MKLGPNRLDWLGVCLNGDRCVCRGRQASLALTVIIFGYLLQQRYSPFVSVAVVSDNFMIAHMPHADRLQVGVARVLLVRAVEGVCFVFAELARPSAELGFWSFAASSCWPPPRPQRSRKSLSGPLDSSAELAKRVTQGVDEVTQGIAVCFSVCFRSPCDHRCLPAACVGCIGDCGSVVGCRLASAH